MRSRFELLSLVVLMALASTSLTLGASGGDGEASGSSAVADGGDEGSSAIAAVSTSMMGDLIFDHEEHAEEMDLECDDCHHETNARPLEFPHEEYFHDLWIDCGICHHEPGSPELEPQSCYECHDGASRDRDIADERLSAKVVLHQNCWQCHEVETGVEASESCELCHTGMEDDF